MLSVIVYGRNDSYGYNLHRRAAMSLNAIAREMAHPTDEIIFVDYNSSDDGPTFPEAIDDVLTADTKSRLRIIRVRAGVHARLLGHRTHLHAVEAVARNVGIRRSNPENRWVLSTNTDMIFLTHDARPLSAVVGNLDPGYYCAPRVEVPEFVWEGFDRRDPERTAKELRRLRRSLHLDEVVDGIEGVLYDAPGDFQLALREDLFAIGGFNESMLRSWHVDSNLARRLYLLRGRVDDAGEVVMGYHLDHIRTMTAAHSGDSPENDIELFFTKVVTPVLPEQIESWGFADLELEEIRLGERRSKMSAAIHRAFAQFPEQSYRSAYTPQSYGDFVTAPHHVLPYLINVLESLPPSTEFLWLGPEDELFRLAATVFADLGMPTLHRQITERWSMSEDRVAMINFGTPHSAQGAVRSDLLEQVSGLVGHEIGQREQQRPVSRVIGINCIHNEFERLMTQYFLLGKTPFSTRLRIGSLRAEAQPPPMVLAGMVEEWIERVVAGPAGRRRRSRRIGAKPRRGHMAFGPNAHLPTGAYRAEFTLESYVGGRLRAGGCFVEIAVGGVPLVQAPMAREPGRQVVSVSFAVSPEDSALDLETRVHVNGWRDVRVTSIRLKRVL